MNMTMKTALQRAAGRSSLLRDERGLSTVEYVVLLVLICAGCVGLWATFGKDVYDRLNHASGEFSTHVPDGDGENGDTE